MATDVERYRGTSQFAEIGSRITRRPSSHTDRATVLGLEPGRQHRLPRHLGSHKGEIHMKRASGERTFVKPPSPRPEVSERQQIADGWEGVEIPQVIREVMVVDFSAGVDEDKTVRRPDAFELSFAPPAAAEEAVEPAPEQPAISVHHQRALSLTPNFRSRRAHGGEIVAAPRVKHGSINDDNPGRHDPKTDDEWEAHDRHQKRAMREAAAIDILNESFGPDYAEREDSQPEISGEGKVVWSSDWLNEAPLEDEAVDFDPYLVEESRRVAGEAVVTEDAAFIDSDLVVSFKELQEHEADMDPQGFFDYGITARDLREFDA